MTRKGPAPQLLPWIRRVALKFDDTSACLIWPFFRQKSGYPGSVRYEGKSNNAHHVVCRMAHGEPPETRPHAAHSCGKGHEGCVSPWHLRWTSVRDNHLEKWQHGTGQFGEAHGRAKITETDVLAIRRSRMSQRKLAAKYGLTQSTVWAIVNNETWRHI